MGFLEVNCLGEVEVQEKDVSTEKGVNVNVDVNELIGKVRDFVGSFKEMGLGGGDMAVSVDGFNFSFGKKEGQYDLDLTVNLVFKPKNSNPKA
jgi:hypothetical protein